MLFVHLGRLASAMNLLVIYVIDCVCQQILRQSFAGLFWLKHDALGESVFAVGASSAMQHGWHSLFYGGVALEGLSVVVGFTLCGVVRGRDMLVHSVKNVTQSPTPCQVTVNGDTRGCVQSTFPSGRAMYVPHKAAARRVVALETCLVGRRNVNLETLHAPP